MNAGIKKNKRIDELVTENYVHAYVLYYFGIRFYEYSEFTLEQACNSKGLRLDQVIKELESPMYLKDAELPLASYPIDLIIEYLKHAHFLFIKHKLPYIAKLIENFKAAHPDFYSIERDLKTVFPLFVQDFIEHIYEEEDTFFRFIQNLDKASKGKIVPTRLFYLLEKNSVQKFAMEHERHDDEMEGIRTITQDYNLNTRAPLYIKVLYNELKAFEKSLILHASIENDILFPKALALENEVKQKFYDRSKLN
jgi:regulator of cell morphogenesis and NO signaling